MTDIKSHDAVRGHEPVDAVTERLNDPTVAASLVTLLDNAELLSTLVLGLGGLIERGDMIMDAVAEGVNDFKKAGGVSTPEGAPSISELGQMAGQLSAATPALARVTSSAMVEPETIDLLSMLSEAATEGAARARQNDTEVSGVFSAMKQLRDPEVQKGLGFVIEIAKALGRRLD